jgi:transcriptional regulator with XRE-family HTH domain
VKTVVAKLGEVIQKRRGDVSQPRFAVRCGISPTTLARLEQQKAGGVSLEVLGRIAAGLGMKLSKLIQEAEDKK